MRRVRVAGSWWVVSQPTGRAAQDSQGSRVTLISSLSSKHRRRVATSKCWAPLLPLDALLGAFIVLCYTCL